MTIDYKNGTLLIKGNVKSIQDYQLIRSTIEDRFKDFDTIPIYIDSIAITSTVIGYFNKLIHEDKKKIVLHVQNPSLYKILSELHLLDTFNVIKDFDEY